MGLVCEWLVGVAWTPRLSGQGESNHPPLTAPVMLTLSYTPIATVSPPLTHEANEREADLASCADRCCEWPGGFVLFRSALTPFGRVAALTTLYQRTKAGEQV